MHDNEHWQNEVIRILKAAMARSGMSYRDLAPLLGETPENLRNKVRRGKFSAAFYAHALSFMGVRTVEVPAPPDKRASR